MAALKKAVLINDQGCHFDSIALKSLRKIKEWAKGRGGSYLLEVESDAIFKVGISNSVRFSVKNNRLYKINNGK